MKTKKCNKCGQTKPINDFYKCKSNDDGLQYRCKSCVLENSKKWRNNNRDTIKQYYINNKDHMKQNMMMRYRQLKTDEPWVIMYKAIKQRAKSKKMDFDLTPEYIKSIWSDTCPVLGIPLYSAIFESGQSREKCKAKPMKNSPTMDRIDSNKGYIQGNVCIMSYRANMIKNCGTLEEHRKIVDFFKNYMQ